MAEVPHMLPPLRTGEYDLVNISLIGHDPITGRSFEECHAEWKAMLDAVLERDKRRRWWDLAERFRVARWAWILTVRQGMN